MLRASYQFWITRQSASQTSPKVDCSLHSLAQVQRRAELMITGCLSTTPYSSLDVECCSVTFNASSKKSGHLYPNQTA